MSRGVAKVLKEAGQVAFVLWAGHSVPLHNPEPFLISGALIVEPGVRV